MARNSTTSKRQLPVVALLFLIFPLFGLVLLGVAGYISLTVMEALLEPVVEQHRQQHGGTTAFTILENAKYAVLLPYATVILSFFLALITVLQDSVFGIQTEASEN